MQLGVFSTDNQKSGFRLQYMEVYNWGTFDETIHSIRPQGESSLLTGSNGSGKTTFVDALLTLIVPEKKYRFYNQSSGSEKKGDRTEDSYVLGGYGTVNSESTGSIKSLYLRENKEEAFSILLAHFSNEEEQFVTLFQVRYFAKGEMKKVFGIAHKPLQIETDFKPFDLTGQWKKTIDQRYNKGSRKQVEWFDASSKYAQRLVEVLGMQSIQALQLFNQTVGIKVLGNLDEFIRTHMLEPRNMQQQFLDLKEQLATLLDARRNIEKTEEQIRLLEQLKEQDEHLEKLKSQLTKITEELEIARHWRQYTKYQLLSDSISQKKEELKTATDDLEKTRFELLSLNEQERTIKNQIDQNKAGQRLQQLEQEHLQLQQQYHQVEFQLAGFSKWAETLKLQETQPDAESSYLRIKKENEKKGLSLTREQRLNEEEEYEAKSGNEKYKKERDLLEAELNHLRSSKSNIPSSLTAVRKHICEALNLEPQDLPFAGELMQTNEASALWQPALEKLLRPYALRILVPDNIYKKVTRYVNNNNMRTRLVYEHIRDIPLKQHPEPGSVHEKLAFHPEHKMAKWVEQQIIRTFQHICLEEEKGMDRYDKAITLNGLIKNGQRHEKDDRPESNDPSRYVMGWDNEKKKERLLQQRNKLSTLIEERNETIERCKRKSDTLQAKFHAYKNIQEHNGFQELDLGGLQRKMHKLQEQMDALRKENKVLDHLKHQLNELQENKTKAEFIQRTLYGKEAILQKECDELQSQMELLNSLLLHLTEIDKDRLLQFQLHLTIEFGTIQLENIEQIYLQLKEEKERQQSKLSEQKQQCYNGLSRAIYQIKRPSALMLQKFPDWLGDVDQLPEDPQYSNEYVEWLNKLVTENLPAYKRKFETYINETITYKIASLKEELEKWEKDIHQSIIRLNLSLSGINFNKLPDTYIQLHKKTQNAGSEVAHFKSKLQDAMPVFVRWNQEDNFEEKSNHFTEKVKPLIDELDENEHYRNKVLDVRNWFEYWADEKYRNTGELKKSYRQMGQLSGGEKAQLTYTILCSAIAYQFGITREGKKSKSLRFIAVDESFSNQDEEKATYLMELCKQLHLQLLVVTPSDKIQIVQDYIAHVHLVQRVQNRNSVIYNMTILQLLEERNTETKTSNKKSLK